jgi:hypothetical protein
LNAYLWPLRSAATWGNGGPHSGSRHLADKDEVPGSSPGRPTTPHLTSGNAVVFASEASAITATLVIRLCPGSWPNAVVEETSYLVTDTGHAPGRPESPRRLVRAAPALRGPLRAAIAIHLVDRRRADTRLPSAPPPLSWPRTLGSSVDLQHTVGGCRRQPPANRRPNRAWV